MKNFFKANLKRLIISSFAILCPIIFGLIFWNKLPELMTVHYGITGEADGFGGKYFAVFGLPSILLALHWLCMIITSTDKKNKNQNPKVFSMIFWIMPLTSIYVSSVLYSGILGYKFNVGLFTMAFIGILFIVIGNYMPKCKQNSTIGIKIKWTLANEENWNATHRLGGKLWVLGGIVILLLSLFPIQIAFIALVPIVLLMVIIPAAYSSVYFKKQLKNNSATLEELKNFTNDKSILTIVITVILVLVTVTLCLFLCFTGDIEIVCDYDTFTVKADYYNDISVKYSEIASIEYRQTDSPGTRVFGFGTPRLRMGSFSNNEFGNYTRYSYSQCNSCIVLTVNGNILVINGINDARTLDIYNKLVEKCN